MHTEPVILVMLQWLCLFGLNFEILTLFWILCVFCFFFTEKGRYVPTVVCKTHLASSEVEVVDEFLIVKHLTPKIYMFQPHSF